MELDAAVLSLAALAQESRLAVFRMLVRVGPPGIPAGEIAGHLRIPPSTLSFHLQLLETSGLVSVERRGRSLLYSLRPEALRELLWFLGEDCCQGRTDLCVMPSARIEQRREEATKTCESLPPRVLFVCSRNSARSQMAEAILRDAAGDRVSVASAGISPSEVHPFTVRVLKEVGLVSEPLKSKDLSEFLGKVPIHHAIVVCEAANTHCPKLVPFAVHTHYWPFPDPVMAKGSERVRLREFRGVRDAIAQRVRRWARKRPWETAGRLS